jgi:uncharacterized protein (TIGR02996 family)
MSEERAFLDALAENPADDLTRLVYADWLEERGQSKARYLRLVCELARMPREEMLESTAHDEILALAPVHSTNWQQAVGRRFEVALIEYTPTDSRTLIQAIIRVLDLYHHGEVAEDLVRAVPVALRSPLTYDDAVHLYHEWKRYEHWFPVRPLVVVRPVAAPAAAAGALYDVVLHKLPRNFWANWARYYRDPISHLLEMEPRPAHDHVARLPAVLVRGVAWADLEATLRRVRQAFNQWGAELLPPDALSVVPHTAGGER